MIKAIDILNSRDNTPLETEVLEITLESEGQDFVKYAEEVLSNGCIQGAVPQLTYYCDTTSFYKRHEDEILMLLEEYGEPKDVFNEKWNSYDEIYDLIIQKYEGNKPIPQFYLSYKEYKISLYDWEHSMKEELENIDEFEDVSNQNLLTWFAFEVTLYRLLQEYCGG